MQKQKNFLNKNIITILTSISLINFTSAYGSYYDFNMRNLLDSFDPQTMFLVVGFIVIFALLNFIFSKFFKDKYGETNKATAGIVSFSISLLAIYGLNRSNFDIQNLFYSIGIPEGILPTLIPIILIVAFFWLSYSKKQRKFKFYKPFLILGTLLLLVTIFTDFIYEKGTATVLGMILLLIGFWLWKRSKKRGYSSDDDYSDNKGSGGDKKQTNSPNPQQQRQQRATRNRSRRELQTKYNEYSQKIQQIQKNNNGRIPARGTKPGNLRHRYIQAMKAIENLARKKGIRLR